MSDLSTTVLLAIIRESISLFVLLVFLYFSYRLVDKFGTQIFEVMSRIAVAIEKIATKRVERR